MQRFRNLTIHTALAVFIATAVLQVSWAGEDEESLSEPEANVALANLWKEAAQQSKEENWEAYASSLDEICRVNPKFVSVWKYAAWNYAHNLASKEPNPKQRYALVSKGIQQLVKGISHNKESAALHWDLGWLIGKKISEGEDSVSFRNVFANDTELHDLFKEHIDLDEAKGRDGRPDSWLVARLWHLEAERHVTNPRSRDSWPISPVLLLSSAPMCQINYARTLYKKGEVGNYAIQQWREAQRQWEVFGKVKFPILQSETELVSVKSNKDFVSIVSYDFWLEQCKLEQTEEVVNARKALQLAYVQHSTGKSKDAKQQFQKAWKLWASLIEKHKRTDFLLGPTHYFDIYHQLERYKNEVLEGGDFPADFPLAKTVAEIQQRKEVMEKLLEEKEQEEKAGKNPNNCWIEKILPYLEDQEP